MTIEGPRVIDKTLSYADVSLGSIEPFPATLTGSNWSALENVATPSYVNRTYYDMSGYSVGDLTAFFNGVDIQEGFTPFGSAACHIVDLITTEYITDSQILNAYPYTTGDGDLPGFPRSLYNMEQVIYGRSRTFGSSAQWGDIALQGQSFFGTCTASTTDKIHITRILYVLSTATADQTVHVPPCNYVTALVVGKEKELPFMMRQKRSYEHANR